MLPNGSKIRRGETPQLGGLRESFARPEMVQFTFLRTNTSLQVFGKPQNDAEPYSAIRVHRLTVVDSPPWSHSFLLPHH